MGGERLATAVEAVDRKDSKASTLSMWPFDGALIHLLSRPGVVVAETYPGEVYHHLGFEIVDGKRSKRRQSDRKADAFTMQNWAQANHIQLTDALRNDIVHGFGSKEDGEDRFDAVVGLLGMLNVVLGHREPGVPEDESGVPDDEITRVEGWILGQHAD